MPEERKRGRPSKKPHMIDSAAIKRVKKMAKGYNDAKLRTRYYENTRRSLLEKAGIDKKLYKDEVVVRYDADEVSNWPDKDKAIFNQYIIDKQTTLCIEKGIASIEDVRTREIAQKTIIEGKSCDALTGAMGIERRMLFYRKKEAITLIAEYVALVTVLER